MIQATQTEDMQEAFNYSDTEYQICSLFSKLCNVAKTTGSAICKGVCQGIQNYAPLEQLKALAQGVVAFAQIAIEGEWELAELDRAVTGFDDDYKNKFLTEFYHKGVAFQELILDEWQTTVSKLEHMRWDEVLEQGSQIGATLLFDLMLCNAAVWATGKVGRAVIEGMHTALKSSPEAAHVYCTEVAGIAKAAVEVELVEAEMGAVIEVVVTSSEKELLLGEKLVKEVKKKKKSKKKKIKTPYVIEYITPIAEKKLFPEEYIEEAFKHIFSGKHKKKGLLDLGRTEEEITKKFQNIVQKLYEEGMLAIGDNQIQTTICNLPVEIHIHFFENMENVDDI